MLAGAPPFSGATEYDLTQAQIHAEAPPLVPRISGVTPEVESAIMTALSKRPEHRFPNLRGFSDALGATALRIDAPAVIRNAGHLVQDSTAERDVPTQERLSTKLVALAKSRSATAVRRFKGLHPALQGVMVGAGAVAILGSLYFGLQPSFSSDERMSREISLADKKSRGDDIRGRDADAGYRRAAPRNSTTFGVDENQASTVPAYDRRPREDEIETKFARTESRAREGDQKARYELGMLYLQTPGRQKLEDAFKWLKMSAEQGHPDAQYELGKMYTNGLVDEVADDVRLRERLAADWWEKAARSGHAKAQFQLGRIYEGGAAGRKRDRREAKDWYSKASAQGDANATEALRRIR
jgi:serine/threonine-protein kinase